MERSAKIADGRNLLINDAGYFSIGIDIFEILEVSGQTVKIEVCEIARSGKWIEEIESRDLYRLMYGDEDPGSPIAWELAAYKMFHQQQERDLMRHWSNCHYIYKLEKPEPCVTCGKPTVETLRGDLPGHKGIFAILPVCSKHRKEKKRECNNRDRWFELEPVEV